MSNLQSILSQINGLVDPPAFVRLLDYHPDKILSGDDSIKCFCPVHRERAVRSLIIHVPSRTYKCMMKHCACFKGGPLVELWGLHRQLAPIEAALDLAERMNLPVDMELFQRLGTQYVDQAVEALNRGDLPAARALINSALELDPHSLRLRMFSAQVSEAEGLHGRALEQRIEVFDTLIREKRLDEAGPLLARLLEVYPEAEELVEREIELARLAGRSEALADALGRKAARCRRQGLTAEALAALDEAARLAPTDAELIEELANLHEQSGSMSELLSLLKRLATIHREAGQIESLLATLERLAQLRPVDLEVDDELCLLLEQTGRAEEARPRRLGQVERLARDGDPAEAARRLDAMLDAEPARADWLRLRAELAVECGDHPRALEIYRDLAAQAAARGEAELTDELLDQACRLDPHDPSLRRQQAELRLARCDAGNGELTLADRELLEVAARTTLADKGAEAARRLVERWLASFDAQLEDPAALAAWRFAVEHYPAEGGWQGQLVRMLIAADEREEAAGHLEHMLAVAADPSTRQDLVQQLLALCPDREDLRREQAQLLAAADQPAAAAATYEQLADEKLDAGDMDEAFDLLELALAQLPQDRRLLEKSAACAERAGRLEAAAGCHERLVILGRSSGDAALQLAAIERLLVLCPDREDLRREQAQLLAAADQPAAAAAVYEQLADVKAHAGEVDEALPLLELALAQLPQDRRLLEKSAACAERAGRPEAAAGCYERLVALGRSAGDCELELAAIRHLVALAPDRGDLAARLAECLEARGDVEAAASQYYELARASGAPAESVTLCRRITAFHPDFTPARDLLVESLVALGETGEACGELEALGEQALAAGRLDQAESYLRRASELSPADPQRIERLARLLEDQGRLDEAAEIFSAVLAIYESLCERAHAAGVLQKLVRLRPEDPAARLRLAHFYSAEGSDPAEAARHWLELVAWAADRDDRDTLATALADAMPLLREQWPWRLECARLLTDRGMVDLAPGLWSGLLDDARAAGLWDVVLQAAEAGLALTPDSTHMRRGRIEAARELSRPASALEDLRWLAADAEANHPEEAERHLSEALELAPEDDELLAALGRLQARLGRWAEAAVTIRRLAELLERLGRGPEALAQWRRLAELDPDDLALRERLADMLHELGQQDEARAIFVELATRWREELGRADEALRILARLQELYPGEPEFLRRRAALLEQAGDAPAAATLWRELAAILETSGQDAECAEALIRAAGLVDDAAADWGGAAAALRRLGRDEEALDAIMRAIEIHDRLERPAEMEPLLARAVELAPDRLDLPEALAQIQERLGQPAKAAVCWLGLAARHEREARPEVAIRIYQHLTQTQPANIEARRRLAELCEAGGDQAEAAGQRRELARLASATGNHLEAAAQLKRLLEFNPHDEAALLALIETRRSLGDWEGLGEVMEQLADAHAGAGRLDQALAVLRRLEDLRPDQPLLVTRIVDLLLEVGQVEPALGRGRELVGLWLEAGEPARALQALHRLAQVRPEDHRLRIALLRVLVERGAHAIARDEYRQATGQALETGRLEEALELGNDGVMIYSDDALLRDLVARALARLGRLTEAIQAWLGLAALHDERNEPDQAQLVYETLLEAAPGDCTALEALVDWALRRDRLELAIDQLVRLAETQYQAGALDEAILTLGRIRALDPSRLDLVARLAEIYLEAGRPMEARAGWLDAARAHAVAGAHAESLELFRKAVDVSPDDPELLAELLAAAEAAGEDETHRGEGLRLAALYESGGRADDALALYEALAERHPADDAILARLCALYEARGLREEAIAGWRRLHGIHREAHRLEPARQCLQSALALQPDHPELLESLGDLCLTLGRRPEGVAHLARAARALRDSGHFDRARELSIRSLKLDPLNLELRGLLAESLERLGQTSAAIEEYTQAARGLVEAHRDEEARELLEHLLALDPSRQDERELLAGLLARGGQAEVGIHHYLSLIERLDAADDPRRAIKYCRQILALAPDHPEAHAHLCTIYERTEKFRQAFKECEWLADHHAAHEDFDRALEATRRALRWFPDDLPMRRRLVDLLMRLERHVETAEQLVQIAALAESRADARTATWALELACRIQPDNLEHLRRLAEYQERSGESHNARRTRLDLIRRLLLDEQMEPARLLAERVVAASGTEREEISAEVALLFEEAGLPEIAAWHYHQLAQNALGDERFEDAKGLAYRALGLKLRHVPTRQTLIAALRGLGENNLALEEYERLYDIHHQNAEWELALSVLREMIELAPAQPQPHHRMVGLLRQLGRHEQMIEQLRHLTELLAGAGDMEGAIGSLRELLEERPEDTRARLRFIDLYSRIGDEVELVDHFLQLARVFTAKGSVVEATRAYEKLIAIHPTLVSAREEFIQFLSAQGQLHRAVEESLALAEALVAEGQAAEAGRVLERIIALTPDDPEPRRRLAEIYLLTHRRGLALETWRWLAHQREQSGDDHGLLEALGRIVAIDNLNTEYRQRLVELAHRLGESSLACEHTDVLVRQYTERGLHDLAVAASRRLLEIEPDHPRALESLVRGQLAIGAAREVVAELTTVAENLARAGQIAEAVLLYRQAIEQGVEEFAVLRRYIDLYPQVGPETDLIDVYLRLAELLSNEGQGREAAKIYQRLLQLSPGHTVVRDLLAALRTGSTITPVPAGTGARTGVPAADRQQLERFLRSQPDNIEARLRLAELLEASDPAAADPHLYKAAHALFERGELERGIQLATRYLERHPEDQALRRRLSEARRQNQSFDIIHEALARELKNL